jgi:CheY-like chemotaxis protein
MAETNHIPKTVVLAEPDLVVRQQIASRLRADGYHVVEVDGGLELCDYLELARFSEGRVPAPDVIVSDADLTGYDGIQICRQVSSEVGGTPFIMLVPAGDVEMFANAEHAGAAHVLEQPIEVSMLLDAVAYFSEQQ